MNHTATPEWLSLPSPLRVVAIENNAGRDPPYLSVTIASEPRSAPCPDCRRRARHIHSRYTRTLKDSPIFQRPVVIHMRVRRFFCRNRRCPRRIFCERLPDLTTPHAQRTDRLKQQQVQVGLALGGRPGARFAKNLGQPVSFKTLLRSIRAAPAPVLTTPRCLGVDDWAFRKGCRYGTILVDLEAHKPVDLLPDRKAESLAEWLQSHPGVEVISRDRAGAYAEGARTGAPDALQVADRFHLAKNLGDAVERLLNRHRTTLREAWKAIRKEAKPEAVIVESVAVEAMGVAVEADPVPIADEPASTNDRETWQSRCEEEKRLRRAWRYERYEQIKAYHQNGLNIAQIARAMHMERKTVRMFLRADVYPEHKPYPRRRTILDDFRPAIQALWDSGCHNAAKIFRDLEAKGYTGQYTTVRIFAHTLRPPKSPPNTIVSMSVEPAEVDRSSPRRVAAIVLKKLEGRSTWEQTLLAEVDQVCEPFRAVHTLAQGFLDLLHGPKDTGTSADFAAWMTEASGSTDVDVRRFVRGLEQDRAAVEAAMALPWSNGPVEGAVNRLKTIKRQMYGRANFDLLRRRVLETP